MCLIPLSSLVTLSCFDEGKEFRIICSKWPRNPMLNVVATLQQRCRNVLTKLESVVVTTSETDVGTTLIIGRVTTLLQRRCSSWGNGKICSWKFRKTHTPLPESRFLINLQTGRLQLYWKETPVQGILVNFVTFSRVSLLKKWLRSIFCILRKIFREWIFFN